MAAGYDNLPSAMPLSYPLIWSSRLNDGDTFTGIELINIMLFDVGHLKTPSIIFVLINDFFMCRMDITTKIKYWFLKGRVYS